MKTRIKLNNVCDVKEFVSKAQNCDFDIDVQYRHIIIDGKSLVGLMSMDLTLELIVYYNGSNSVFENMLKMYEVKEIQKL